MIVLRIFGHRAVEGSKCKGLVRSSEMSRRMSGVGQGLKKDELD